MIGRKEAIAYVDQSKNRASIKPSATKFRFGSSLVVAIAAIEIEIPTPCQSIIEMIDIVDCDVPLLFGLELINCHGL